jgi:hypothetical protein
MRATILGSAIRVYFNETLIVAATDETFAEGNPGIGFFTRAGASNRDFGFTAFAAIGR